MLRKTFSVRDADFEHTGFTELSLYVDVTSLGYHEVYVNGTKVGDDVLQPAVSQLVTDSAAQADVYVLSIISANP